MALTRVWIPSSNFSSRAGASVRLIVLHLGTPPKGPEQ
jgi:hypothetical protein